MRHKKLSFEFSTDLSVSSIGTLHLSGIDGKDSDGDAEASATGSLRAVDFFMHSLGLLLSLLDLLS